MSKNKLQKFAEVKTFPNVIQCFDAQKAVLQNNEGAQLELREQWRSEFFQNKNPLVLELACGKGDYTLGLARKHPEKNFLGIDIKGARIWKGAKKALNEGLQNVGFLRIRIELLEQVFDQNEIDEIWITFPDPFPRKVRQNRRLTSPRFVDIYRHILKPGGKIHLKSDADSLFEYTLEVLEELNIPPIAVIEDIYTLKEVPEDLQIKTFYERQHLEAGKTIKYISFTLGK